MITGTSATDTSNLPTVNPLSGFESIKSAPKTSSNAKNGFRGHVRVQGHQEDFLRSSRLTQDE